MIIGGKYRLIESCKSGKGTIYAKAGSEVTLISIHDPAAIVDYNGNKFSTTVKNLKR